MGVILIGKKQTSTRHLSYIYTYKHMNVIFASQSLQSIAHISAITKFVILCSRRNASK